jgi:hypothetical protein
LIYLINVFARATAEPAAMFVDLVLGRSAETVFAKFPPSGDMRTRATTITMEGPKLGLQGITRRSVEGTEIGAAGGVLLMKGRVEVPFSEKNWRSTGCHPSGRKPETWSGASWRPFHWRAVHGGTIFPDGTRIAIYRPSGHPDGGSVPILFWEQGAPRPCHTQWAGQQWRCPLVL